MLRVGETCLSNLIYLTYLILSGGWNRRVHFTSRFRSPNPIPHIKIGPLDIVPVDKARNLGIILDSHLTLRGHINKICSSASKSIHEIGKIRKYLSTAQTEKLVHAFISSNLDYCNSILTGLPLNDINKLQRIQNTAARLITLTKKSSHITPTLITLHWLPVKQRIIFKILKLTHKSLHGIAPLYISELLERRNVKQPRTLRSSQCNLTVPKTKTKTYGDRAFQKVAPNLWNNLPDYLKNTNNFNDFKSLLKTYLFNQAYF